jgi:pyridoxal phosphate enzyme (YggS family)
MTTVAEQIAILKADLPVAVTLVAVSKTKPAIMIEEAYAAGQRDFGENYVQELVDKEHMLPKDIRWHFIGHLQSNKVKFIAPFVHLIHAVDSVKLLIEIQKQALKCNRIIDVLLQLHVAKEETKFGWDVDEMLESARPLFQHSHVRIRGLMAMASNTEDTVQIAREFQHVKQVFEQLKQGIASDHAGFDTLSMGMSGDWRIAVEHGGTMIRLGSTIFGQRNYATNTHE